MRRVDLERFTVGNQRHGELGIGTTVDSLIPKTCGSPAGDSGFFGTLFSCAVIHSDVYCWGDNRGHSKYRRPAAAVKTDKDLRATTSKRFWVKLGHFILDRTGSCTLGRKGIDVATSQKTRSQFQADLATKLIPSWVTWRDKNMSACL